MSCFFVATNFTELKTNLLLNWYGTVTKTQQVTYLSKIWVGDLGPRDPEKTYPGSSGQKSTESATLTPIQISKAISVRKKGREKKTKEIKNRKDQNTGGEYNVRNRRGMWTTKKNLLPSRLSMLTLCTLSGFSIGSVFTADFFKESTNFCAEAYTGLGSFRFDAPAWSSISYLACSSTYDGSGMFIPDFGS